MRLLTIDIGTGTQDILLFDSSQTIENCVKMVMPSPTAIVARKVEEATTRRRNLLLSGTNMGGGPNRWAVERHLKAGLRVYATPEAACTFDDDPAEVDRIGISILAPEEARQLRDVEQIELRDLDLPAIRKALSAFGVEPRFDGLGIAVLDHGAAPPGVSDRLFRFHNLRSVVEQGNGLTAFAYLAEEIPPHLTRMKAVARSAGSDVPLLLLDTGPAAALGAQEDREVKRHRRRVIANLGNQHTLAFHLHGDLIQGLFEHHTGRLTVDKIDSLIQGLVKGTLTNEEVFNDGGHGCFVIGKSEAKTFLAVTGPRRSLIANSTLKPYFAVPLGDVMLTGCFGLVRCFALRFEAWREEIESALGR